MPKPIVFSDWCPSDWFPSFDKLVSIDIDQFSEPGYPAYRVFLQLEPNEIRSNIGKIVERQKSYDLILTWNTEILSRCPNAILFPFGGCWTREPNPPVKEFAASFLVTDKLMCQGHRFRNFTFVTIPDKVGQIPVIKKKTPPRIDSKWPMLAPFQYSIIMENAKHENYFTEKLVDCLATKTIPLYWGCTNVEDFFNPDGILGFNTYEELIGFMQNLTPEFYESRRAAIEDNYNWTFEYADIYARAHRVITKVMG